MTVNRLGPLALGLGLLAGARFAPVARAQAPSPTPTPTAASTAEPSPSAEVVLAMPKPQPTVFREVQVRAPLVEAQFRNPASAAALNRVTAVRIEEGKALVNFDGADLALKPGDTLAGDLVKTITPGRIVLQRSSKTESLLIFMTFDKLGRTAIQTIGSKNPTLVPAAPPAPPSAR